MITHIEIEVRQVTYRGRNKFGGWNYTANELGTVRADAAACIEDCDALARAEFPAATHSSIYEVHHDGRRSCFASGVI